MVKHTLISFIHFWNDLGIYFKNTTNIIIVSITLYFEMFLNFLLPPILSSTLFGLDTETISLIKDNITLITLTIVCIAAIINVSVGIINRSTKKIEKEKAKEDLEKTKLEKDLKILELESKRLDLENKKIENKTNDLLFTLHAYQESIANIKETYKNHAVLPKEYFDEVEKVKAKYNIDKFLNTEI